MATLRKIREGIETRLATISGLRTFTLAPAKVPGPAAWVQPVGFSDETFEPSVDRTMAVVVAVPTKDLRTAQDRLDELLDVTGPKSVKMALEGDPTLGGIVADIRVTADDYRVALMNIGGVDYLTGELTVAVME
jgi:hypothetical protein